MKNKRIKNCDEFFGEILPDELIRKAKIDHVLSVLAANAYDAKQKSGCSFRLIAEKMGLKSHAVVQRIVNDGMAHNVTLSTLIKFGQACGFDVDIKFVRNKNYDGEYKIRKIK